MMGKKINVGKSKSDSTAMRYCCRKVLCHFFWLIFDHPRIIDREGCKFQTLYYNVSLLDNVSFKKKRMLTFVHTAVFSAIILRAKMNASSCAC